PLAILAGHGNIIPGLEKAMEGREAGDKFSVDVSAAEAYGEKREGLPQRAPKKHFGGQRLEPGMQVVLNTNFGPRAVTIEKVGRARASPTSTSPVQCRARSCTSTSRSSRCARPATRNSRTSTRAGTVSTTTEPRRGAGPLPRSGPKSLFRIA